jgi:hypothetical protein
MYDLNTLTPLQHRWLRRSNVPLRFWGMTMQDLEPYADDGAVRHMVATWMDKVAQGEIIRARGLSCGLGLCLIGQPGHGKTVLSTVIAQTLIRSVTLDALSTTQGVRPTRPIYFSYYPEMLDLAKKAMNNDDDADSLIDALYGRGQDIDTVRVLILDDLGKEHTTASKWAEHFFDHLLRSRFDRGLPTIITSNVPLDAWRDVYGISMSSFAHEALLTIGILSPKGDHRL